MEKSQKYYPFSSFMKKTIKSEQECGHAAFSGETLRKNNSLTQGNEIIRLLSLKKSAWPKMNLS